MARYRGKYEAAKNVAGRRRRSKLRRGVTGTAIAAAAMTALTASQAPSMDLGAQDGPGKERADEVPDEGTPGDDSYHTELPPLESPAPPRTSPNGPGAGSDSGIPATVLAAYKKAERTLAGTDRSCGLRWELLAAIGKVESGQARGGAVDKEGTTLKPILGPVLNGAGFAHIGDTDGGRFDGDGKYDRAVGPMQFIPSTWSRWGADGNADGTRDPNNIHDAALAAGKYLCAGGKELTSKADLDRAVLSYNHSEDYLRTVLAWYEFYRKGTHKVPDGAGPLPTSPGAGGADDKPGKGKGGSEGGAHKPGKGDGGKGDGDDGDDDQSPSPAPSKPAALKPVSTPKLSAGTGKDFAKQLQVRVVDKGGKAVKGVKVKYEIIGETDASFEGGATVTSKSDGVATAPVLNAGDETGQFTVKASVVGHDVGSASFIATVNPRADKLTHTAGSVEAAPDGQFAEQVEVTAAYKGEAVPDVPMAATLLDEDGKKVKKGPHFKDALGKPVRTLSDLKSGREGLLGLLSKEGVLKLPTIYTDDVTGTFILRITTPDGPTLDIELTVK